MRRGPGPSAGWKLKQKNSKGGAANTAKQREILEAAVGSATAVIGIDPDSTKVGLCGWVRHPDGSGRDQPAWVASTDVSSSLRGVMGVNEIFEQCCQAMGHMPHGTPLIVVEAMRLRRDSDSATKNPQSIVDLSFLGGIAVAAALRVHGAGLVLPVEPQQWKGTIPKEVHHSRILDQLNWGKKILSDHARPLNPDLLDVKQFSTLKAAHWKHVMDAIGLAKYGIKQLEATQHKLNRRKRHGR